MAPRPNLELAARACRFYVKVRGCWTDGRAQGVSAATLAAAFARAVNDDERAFLSALVRTTRTRRHGHRRWAPVKPARAAVLQGTLKAMYHAKRVRCLTPREVLLASVRARLFAVTSSRLASWNSVPANHRALPYAHLGRALSPATYRRRFMARLQAYHEMQTANETISRRCPLTMSRLAAALDYAGADAWSLSVCINGVALLKGYTCVKLDDRYRRAQLNGGGVHLGGGGWAWGHVMALRAALNKHGEFRRKYGVIRVCEICHLICEVCQFLHRALAPAASLAAATDEDKRKLCAELASWCKRLR